jgi:myo-inositol 2-dehydrogenase/D-chiro-inositol 1-dehydrogenase
MPKLPVAMVGAGHVHAPGYLRCLLARPDVELVGVYDSSPERASALAAAVGASSITSVEEAIDRARAVVVCPEPTRQVQLVQAATEAGRPLLCEKPFGVTSREGRLLLELSGKVPISVAFPVRYHPAAVRLWESAHDGTLGDVAAVWATNRNHFPGGWFADPAMAGGGCLLDHVVHVADLLHWIWGAEWAVVQAEAGVLHNVGLKLEDTAVVLVECRDGMIVTIDPSMSRPTGMPGALDLTLRVWAERAAATVDIFAKRVEAFDARGSLERQLVGADMDAAMIGAWVESVLSDGPPPIPASEGFAATSLAFAAQQAVATRAAVKPGEC